MIVRKAKRLSSNVRQEYRGSAARRAHRQAYVEFLDASTYCADVFQRMIGKIQALIDDTVPHIDKVLAQGHF